jgi:hypothetical protein
VVRIRAADWREERGLVVGQTSRSAKGYLRRATPELGPQFGVEHDLVHAHHFRDVATRGRQGAAQPSEALARVVNGFVDEHHLVRFKHLVASAQGIDDNDALGPLARFALFVRVVAQREFDVSSRLTQRVYVGSIS